MDSSARMKTVTALAVRAKTDNTVIPELWAMVERFVQVICARYCRATADTKTYELDDLCQNAYFGFLKAIDTFDPNKRAFSTHLNYYIRNSCHHEVIKHRKDLITSAISIEKTLNGTDDIKLADAIPDPYAPEAFEAVDQQMIVDTILAEVDRLPHIRQRRIVFECTYQGRTLQSLASEWGISREGARMVEERAIKYLRRNKIIRELRREYFAEIRATADDSATSPYRRKGATSFKYDFTSSIDAVILSREKRGCQFASTNAN